MIELPSAIGTQISLLDQSCFSHYYGHSFSFRGAQICGRVVHMRKFPQICFIVFFCQLSRPDTCYCTLFSQRIISPGIFRRSVFRSIFLCFLCVHFPELPCVSSGPLVYMYLDRPSIIFPLRKPCNLCETGLLYTV